MFPKQKLRVIYEITNCFINLEFNCEKAKKYLKNEKHLKVSKRIIYNTYKEIRRVIYKYLNIIYQTENIGENNRSEYFSVEEILFAHKNGKQVWILGCINNYTKEFRLVGTYNRDTCSLEKFIRKYIPTGNYVITEGWSEYNFLERINSCYIRIKHIHGRMDFGEGIESTSHIESILSTIKAKIKQTYIVIPNKNLF